MQQSSWLEKLKIILHGKTKDVYKSKLKENPASSFFCISLPQRALSDQQVAEIPKSPRSPRMASPLAW